MLAQLQSEHALSVLVLIALRLAPALILLTYRATGVLLGSALAFGFCLSVWPLALGGAAPNAQLWAALPWELARGGLLGLGAIAPIWALGWAGRISEAALSEGSPVPPRTLERFYYFGALAVLFASGAHRLALSALLGSLSDLPLGAGTSDLRAIQAALLGSAQLLGRAFELAVVLAAPVLLVTLSSLLLLGLSQRISVGSSLAFLRGPLLPLVGVSSACLCISSILGELPPAAQVFVDKTLALLRGLQ